MLYDIYVQIPIIELSNPNFENTKLNIERPPLSATKSKRKES